jgi:hypothetical protein
MSLLNIISEYIFAVVYLLFVCVDFFFCQYITIKLFCAKWTLIFMVMEGAGLETSSPNCQSEFSDNGLMGMSAKPH